MTAGFDPAMVFLDLGRNLDLIMWSLVETEFDPGMGGFLVVPGGETIIAARIDDPFGDLRLTAHRIDADEAATQRARGGQFRQQQGIAVISLDLSATARCPSTRLCVVA
jgi:hypothetical protein